MPSTSHHFRPAPASTGRPSIRFLALVGAASLGLVLGACFNGADAQGLPCTADSQCGTGYECIDGYCGGTYRCDDGSQLGLTRICDGTPDCPEAEDELEEACGNAFFCDDPDSTTVPLTATCDGTPDCPDGSDEAPALCELFDRCIDDDEAFEHVEGPSGPGASAPIGIFVENFVGDMRPDFMVAAKGGSFVRIYDLPMDGTPIAYDLEGDNATTPYFEFALLDVVLYDFDGDEDDDIVVLTEGSRVYAFATSPSEGKPQLVAPPASVPDVLQSIGELLDIAAGEFASSITPWAEFVALTSTGRVVSALGDGSGPMLGMSPYIVELTPVVLDGSGWRTIALQNLIGEASDEFVVTGMGADGPVLWVFERVSDTWTERPQIPVPFIADELAFGHFDAGDTVDIALLDRSGRVALVLNNGMSGFPSAGMLEGLGPISGLTVRNFDCSGSDDLIFNVEGSGVEIPAGVRVQLVSDTGELDLDYSLELESMAGRPQGKVAVEQFDGDPSFDIFHTLDANGSLAMPEFRSFVSMPLPE